MYNFILSSFLPHLTDYLHGFIKGSNLGSLLFVIVVNDVVNGLDCYILIYADDIKLFLTTYTVRDCEILQRNNDRFTVWCDTNKLLLNSRRCNVTSFYKSKLTLFAYTIGDVVVNRVDIKKNLGSLLTNNSTARTTLITLFLTPIAFWDLLSEWDVDLDPPLSFIVFSRPWWDLSWSIAMWCGTLMLRNMLQRLRNVNDVLLNFYII